MPYVIAVVAQKGGVGKSTVSRLIASEFARMDGGWDVKIADMDVSQGTSFNWMQRRSKLNLTDIRVEAYQRLEKALADAGNFDVMVLDGAPHATQQTLQMAQAADVVVIPTGTALDDLDPAVLLAHELKRQKVVTSKLVFVLSRTGDSEAEVGEARDYLTRAGYRVAAGAIPERTAFRRASDLGHAISESPFPSLNERARQCFNSIMESLPRAQAAAPATKKKAKAA